MSKFALRGMTQCINEEYKNRGICSTVICPGSFETVSVNEIASLIYGFILLPIHLKPPEIIIGGRL
jgi:NAD(P)-dependent dehydrogenase (short-subunit alcohol dehydrogenase family)